MVVWRSMMQSRDQPALDADGFLVLARTGFATGDTQWLATTDARPDFETRRPTVVFVMVMRATRHGIMEAFTRLIEPH
jgi:hypothetical protein